MRSAYAASLLAVLLAGCASEPRPPEGPPPPIVRATTPAYLDVAKEYNARVGGLERLWTTAVMRLWYTDEEGKARQEQLEGNLQVIRPRRLLFRFDKVSQTFGYLGSNDEQYWWIAMGDSPRAWVGLHENVTPGRIADLGVPLHPLDFIDALGITPLPLTWTKVGAGEAPRVRWSADGRDLIVTVVDGLSRRRLTIDPEVWLARRIELVSPDGSAALTADLAEYVQVNLGGDRGRAFLASEINAALPEGAMRLRLRLSGARATGNRPRETDFDFDRLVQAAGVKEVIDIDAMEQARPRAGAGVGPSPD